MNEREAPRTARRPGRLAVLGGAALVVLGGVASAVGGALEPGTVAVVGRNRPVNAGATDRLDQTAHNSPALRMNPRNAAHLAVANRIDSPEPSCALHVSFDGGATWSQAALPVPEDRAIGCFTPDVAFDAGGRLHVAYTSIGPVQGSGTAPDGVWVVTSEDGGRSFSPPRMAAGPLAFNVRLGADPVRSGRLYLAWVQASQTSTWGFVDEGNPVLVSRSDDGGRTWSRPAEASPPSRARVVAPSIAVGGGGVVHLAYLDVGNDRLDYHGGHEGRGGDPYAKPWSLVVARSEDGGETWTEAVAEPRLVPTQRFLVLFPPAPSVAAHGRRVFVSFHDGRLGDSDVWLWASPDGGRHWRPAVRVNDTPRRDGRTQYLPQVATAPDGRVDVVYYDRRADRADVENSVSLQTSFDHGASFRPRVRLSDRPFDSRIGFGSDRGMPDLGDRLGIVATDGGALGVWTDTRGGAAETGKQDLASGLVAMSRPHGLRGPSRAAGGAMVAAGLLLSAATAVVRMASGGRRPQPGPRATGQRRKEKRHHWRIAHRKDRR